jgi:serine/threonine protein kinase
MLHPQHREHLEGWRARWDEQIELLRSLQMPGLAHVRDGFIGALPHQAGHSPAGQTLYAVMNWVDGVPLDRWLTNQPDLTPADRLRVLLPVAAALDAMHSGASTGGMPVIHGDVKPGNILVRPGDRAVLVDFGLVRCLPDGRVSTGVSGTVGYLAPEVLADGVYTPAVDRYALGAVAYHLLTGHDPPLGASVPELTAAITAVTGAEVGHRVTRMLAADPQDRPAILANWCAQLRQSSLGADLPVESLPPLAAQRHPQRPTSTSGGPGGALGAGSHKQRATRRQLVAGLMAAALAAGVVGAVITRDDAPPETRTASTIDDPNPSPTTPPSSTTTSTTGDGTTTETVLSGVDFCKNTYAGYSIGYPSELVEGGAAASGVGGDGSLTAPCESFNLAGAARATSAVDGSSLMLHDDIVVHEVDLFIDDFFTVIGQPEPIREVTSSGRPARVVEAELTQDLTPWYTSGTYLYMYAMDLGDTTLVIQAAIPPSHRDRYQRVRDAVDVMAQSYNPYKPTSCNNSVDPRCGHFEYTTPPADPKEMTIDVAVSPGNIVKVGQRVTFTITPVDPDAPDLEAMYQCFGERDTCVAGEIFARSLEPAVITLVRQRDPGNELATGPWDPPIPRPSTGEPFSYEWTYLTPGVYTAYFEFRSSHPDRPPGQPDPFGEEARVSYTITVVE